MKCYAKRHALASDAMNAAQLVTKQLLKEQSDRIAARCYNEVWCAMLQVNLSPRTIAHVQKAIAEADALGLTYGQYLARGLDKE